MPVLCANCGEELLGAVNRCWRCGQHVLSSPRSGEAPPVRQAPPDAGIVYAEVAVATEDLPAAPQPSPAAELPTIAAPPRPAEYAQRGFVDVAAIGSIVLGAASLLLGVFFSWALVFGVLGIAAGIAGFRSRWRQLAIVGLLISLMGLAASSARLAYDAFDWWYGRSLLGTPTAPEIDSSLPDSLE